MMVARTLVRALTVIVDIHIIGSEYPGWHRVFLH